MLHTALTELLNIKYPLLQGGMAWVSEGTLAAAVSSAGGLGIIAAGSAPAAVVAAEIERAKTLTDAPFGVNVMLMSPHAAQVAAVVAQHRVAVVTTGAGNPAPYLDAWQAAGSVVIPVIPSVALAKRMEAAGAAAVIAEGSESGGHIGELNTMALVPQVVDAVTVPVIAAGGIADGRGMAAALALGAAGVQMGTRFLVAHECTIHERYKQLVLKARDRDTAATGRRLGHPVRALKTPFTRDLAAKEYDATVSDEQFEQLGVGALRLAAVDGDIQRGCFIAGQVAGMVTRQQTAADIVREVCTQAETRIRDLQGVVR